MPPKKEPIDIGVNVEQRDGQQLVGISFGKKVSWVGLTVEEAEEFGTFILKKAAEIREASA